MRTPPNRKGTTQTEPDGLLLDVRRRARAGEEHGRREVVVVGFYIFSTHCIKKAGGHTDIASYSLLVSNVLDTTYQAMGQIYSAREN